MGYYIANQGSQQGPFELQDLPRQGLRLDSLVWTEGTAIPLVGVVRGVFLAIVFGVLARNRVRRREIASGGGMALAGLICGSVAAAISLLWLAIVIIAIVSGVSRHRF